MKKLNLIIPFIVISIYSTTHASTSAAVARQEKTKKLQNQSIFLVVIIGTHLTMATGFHHWQTTKFVKFMVDIRQEIVS